MWCCFRWLSADQTAAAGRDKGVLRFLIGMTIALWASVLNVTGTVTYTERPQSVRVAPMPRMYRISPVSQSRSFLRTFIRCFLILSCLLMAQVSRADGLYVGVGGYLTDIEVAAQSDDDITPAGFIGYQFIDTNIFMASIELGYYNLGSLRGEILDQSFSVDASATTLAGVAYLPIGPFIEIYGKLGAGRISVDGAVLDASVGDNSTEFFGGVGVAWDIFDTIDIYGEVLQFDNALDSQMIGVGIRFDFF